MSAGGPLSTVVPMSQYGDSADALQAARRVLAARDADLAAADREVARVLQDAHALAVESIGRIDAIDAELDATDIRPPGDTPAAARDLSRQLIARNRDVAAVVREAQESAHAKAVALQDLTDRYR